MEEKTESRVVYIVRHGERLDEASPDSWEAIVASKGERVFDPPLTDKGLEQATKTGERLLKEIQSLGEGALTWHILSSPFKRCMQTATQIHNVLKSELKSEGIKVDEGLAEGGLASWFPDGTPTFPHLSDQFDVDNSYKSCATLTYPETVNAFAQRYSNTITHLTDAFNTANVIILVTHGYGVQFMTETLDPEAFIIETPYCCITKFVYHEPKWFLEYLADGSHAV